MDAGWREEREKRFFLSYANAIAQHCSHMRGIVWMSESVFNMESLLGWNSSRMSWNPEEMTDNIEQIFCVVTFYM